MNLRIFSYLFLITFSHAFIIRNTVKSSLNGLELGLSTITTGILMDNTISKKSLQILKKNSTELYNNGKKKIVTNLLIVGPLYHNIVETYLINDSSDIINIFQTILLVYLHSCGYFIMHRLMHRNDLFRKYHYFHHQFNTTLIPSISNSVSIQEFTLAYMLPFFIGESIVNSNINTFNLAVIIVSFMNLVIHTQELTSIEWNPYFVSPKIHSNHHNKMNNRSIYSAPTFNLEEIFNIYK